MKNIVEQCSQEMRFDQAEQTRSDSLNTFILDCEESAAYHKRMRTLWATIAVVSIAINFGLANVIWKVCP